MTDDTGTGGVVPPMTADGGADVAPPIPAGRGRRFWAAMIDGLIVAPVTIAVHLALYGRVGAAIGPSVVSALPAYAYYLLIGLRPGYARGQSLGKQLIGLRVVTLDGDWVTAREWVPREAATIVIGLAAVVSVAFTWLSLVDLLPILIRPDRRAVHDLIAGTIVVDAHGG